MAPRGGKWLAIGTVAVVAALALILVLAEHGIFTRMPATIFAGAPLPGVTLSDSDDRMPVVTSVRSDGEAERVGIRAGDEIEAIGKQPVHDVAALRAVLLSDRENKLALHIRRGDALWTVALDRAEPAVESKTAMETANGPENPAD
jgi:C-terminal processing protease CtpA/Prc